MDKVKNNKYKCCTFLFEKRTIYKYNSMGLKKVLIVLCLSRDDEAIISLSCAVCFRNCLAKSSFWKRAKLSIKLTAPDNAFLLAGSFSVDHISSFHHRWFYRSSLPDVFFKKGVLRNYTKFTGKHMCQSLYFNKVAGLRPATLLK